MKKEKEFKLYSIGNQQFKFTPIDKHPIFERKVRTVCKWLGITCSASFTNDIVDRYYDDDAGVMATIGCSFRLRQEKRHAKLTLKRLQTRGAAGGARLDRWESEKIIKPNEFDTLIESNIKMNELLKKTFGLDVDCGAFKPILSVKNQRTTIPIKTKRGCYSLTYDVFYYWYDNEYSERFSEVEIESKKGAVDKDTQIDQLREAFNIIFNYNATTQSKLEGGMNWKLSPEEGFKTIYTLIIDIVGYSREAAATQKQMIQKLSKFVRDSMVSHRGASDDVRYISTGDGMIVVFDEKPETIVPIVFSIQDRLHENKRTDGKSIDVRIGLHSGPIFRYTDINGNQNFAGSGVNLAQRVMSLGEAGHILASEEAFRCMGEAYESLKPYFISLGEREVKHGEKLRIYNVLDSEENRGNPNIPN